MNTSSKMQKKLCETKNERIAIVLGSNHLEWFSDRGYTTVSFK